MMIPEEYDELTALTTGKCAREWLAVYFKGISMGATDVVPGFWAGQSCSSPGSTNDPSPPLRTSIHWP